MAKNVSGIARAIEALGGVHQATMKTGIPSDTLRSYRRRGIVPKYEPARILAEASGVPIDDLGSRKTA
jgi:hypothetical protein